MSISKTASAPATLGKRLQIQHLVSSTQPSKSELVPGSDVLIGLTQVPKTLPPRYFYDDQGSELFEQICELPELGSGSSTKTRILLNAYQDLGYPLRYLPIDVSAGILESSARSLLTDYPSLQVHGLVSTYELALAQIEASP